jgi:hypothetical protein
VAVGGGRVGVGSGEVGTPVGGREVFSLLPQVVTSRDSTSKKSLFFIYLPNREYQPGNPSRGDYSLEEKGCPAGEEPGGAVVKTVLAQT